VDECVSQRHVPDVLRAAGHIVYLQRELFLPGTKDVDWLGRVGAEKWILLTKDENIRKRPIEVRALIGAKVKAFVMTAAGQLKGEDQGRLIAKALPRVVRLATKTRPPFVANITASGHVELLDTPKYR
jgi:hypothetical protein